MTATDTAVPLALRRARRWVCWRFLEGRKPPVTADGYPLKNWVEPAGWMTYEDAVAAFASSNAVDGVGFVLGGGVGGLDLDDCRDPATGLLDPKAVAVLDLHPGAYAEVSPSGKGVKVFGLADGWLEVNFRSGAAELKTSLAYFCVTGNALPGRTSLEPLAIDAVLSALGASKTDRNRPRAGDAVGLVPQGRQDDWLTARAAAYAAKGRTEAEIVDLLRVDIKYHVVLDGPDWTDAELERKAETAVQKFGKPAPAEPALPKAAPSLRAFLAEQRSKPAPSWLVDELVADEGVHVWTGRPRSMKSLTAQHVVLDLAEGRDRALNCPRFGIRKPVGILWLAEEDSARMTAARFGLMLKARDVREGEETENLRMVVRPGWNLETAEGQAAILETIRATETETPAPLSVLVIDPLRTSLPSIDGGPQDAARGRAFLLQLTRETPIKVILAPHHDVKPARDGQDSRNRAERSSGGVTFSMADLLVSFERVNSREAMAHPVSYKVSGDPEPFRIHWESDTPEGEPFRGRLAAYASTADAETGDLERAIAFLRKHPWSTAEEVEQGASIRKGSLAPVLKTARMNGVLNSVSGATAKALGRSPKATLYAVGGTELPPGTLPPSPGEDL